MESVRERIQQMEAQLLCPQACQSQQTRGRQRAETECDLRTCFQRDRDRILHCKSFRRLKQKTQVFLSPQGDHYRTRLTHTLEVSQIARTLARALRLNEDLTEAIALGHDLGHTPFGHAGERALNRLSPHGFRHSHQSLRVVDHLERDMQGLNLTWEVRNGIVCHTKGAWPQTLEGCVVRYADRIAYLNHDIEDAIAAGVLQAEQIPLQVRQVLGTNKSQRITTLLRDMVEQGVEQGLHFSPSVQQAYQTLYDFMYRAIYVDPSVKREETKVEGFLEALYSYYLENPQAMPAHFLQIGYQQGMDRAVTDYISGMSDDFAVRVYEDLFVPKHWAGIG